MNFGVTGFAPLMQSAAGALPALSALGGTTSLVSVDAMQEFRIQTSSCAPEFGRTPGGQISISTRSGTNSFSTILGTAYWTPTIGYQTCILCRNRRDNRMISAAYSVVRSAKTRLYFFSYEISSPTRGSDCSSHRLRKQWFQTWRLAPASFNGSTKAAGLKAFPPGYCGPSSVPAPPGQQGDLGRRVCYSDQAAKLPDQDKSLRRLSAAQGGLRTERVLKLF
jgi:hypothetical protein